MALLFLAVWLSGVYYFTLRPFEPVKGGRIPRAAVTFSEQGAQFSPGAALEFTKGVSALRKKLMAAGRMTLEVTLEAENDGQGGPARIISYSRGPMERNFTLAQEGNAVVFRLRTSRTDYNGQYHCLLVPQVFKAGLQLHLGLVFDGTFSRLYVDGEPRGKPQELGGDFSVWGRDHALVLGDEVTGGRSWRGTIRRFSIHDRVLSGPELKLLAEGGDVDGALLACDFQGLEKPEGLRPLHCRNLFIVSDRAAFTKADCIANIAAFLPLALLLYGCSPGWSGWRRKKGWLLAALAGLLISGSVEWLQRGIEGRVSCLADMAYNTLGAGLGFVIIPIFSKRKPRMLNTGENE